MNTTRKPIPELDNLPDDRRDQLHEWLDTLGYMKTIAKLKSEWDLAITYNKLRRYWLRCLEKADFDDALDDELTMPQYLDLLNGRAIPYDQAGIQRIMMRAYHLIGETGQSVTKLATLLRILHYKTACAWTTQRIEISNRLAQVREQELTLKKSRSSAGVSPAMVGVTTPSTSRPRKCDHLGPLAITLEDIRARATAMWGDHRRPATTPRSTGSDAGADLHPNPETTTNP